jgi:hypothetical protein
MRLRRKQDVDARDTSAFTRVFDALCAGMTTERLTNLIENRCSISKRRVNALMLRLCPPYMIRDLFQSN